MYEENYITERGDLVKKLDLHVHATRMTRRGTISNCSLISKYTKTLGCI